MRNNILTILFLLITVPCFAANVLIYNVETGAIKSYRKSVNTPDYEGRNDVLINPDVSLIDSVSRKYLKVSGGVVVEMTQVEKDAIDAAEAQAISDANVAMVDNLEITIKEAFVAWLAVYNSKVPAQYQVTGAELIQQVREDKGL